MIKIGKTLISEDLVSEAFVCDLNKCKGVCCVEGDLGAPLQEEELLPIKKVIPYVLPYLSIKSRKVLETMGAYVLEEDGEYSTTTVAGKECAFAFYDSKGILKCSIERANELGKTKFKKPISCHLYPIRVSKLPPDYEGLNYDKWHICSDACELGKSLKIPVYRFLKAALIRKYGAEWYQELEKNICSR